jgi:hypothetical protein
MTNIKINKLFSSQSCSKAATTLSAKNVPFFINPNGIAAAAAIAQPIVGIAYATTGLVVASLGKPTAFSEAAKPIAGLPAKLIQPKPKLVFLQKKGSQIPNPNIISYNFPAALAAKHKINTVAAEQLGMNKLVTNNVYKLLFNFFKSMYCLISKPVFITTPDKIKIQLFYFLCIPKFLINKTVAAELLGKGKGKAFNGAASQQGTAKALGFNSKDLNVKVNLKRLTQSNLTKVYPLKFKLICTILSKFFNKNVELELIRLHQPYYDSNILVNFLALIINKKNIGACIQRLYNSNIIKANKASAQNASSSDAAATQRVAAYLSGLNIKISGRLMREPIIPRITTKKFEKGFTAKGKINYFDLARFTHKNRKGAFTITVKSGQNF